MVADTSSDRTLEQIVGQYLKGESIAVTGGGGGIGRAMALACAAEGAAAAMRKQPGGGALIGFTSGAFAGSLAERAINHGAGCECGEPAEG